MNRLALTCLALLALCLPCIPLQAAAVTQPVDKFLTIDSDRDGLNDTWEKILGTNPLKADTDGDGFSDGLEVAQGFDPLSAQPRQLDKLIKVSLKDQRLSYYFGGKLLESFLISSGVRGMLTPKGNFTILDKVPSKTYGGTGYNFYFPNTKWNLHFFTGKLRFYIHGAYWHHNFGHPMSHGCVNVSYADMQRLYDWAQVGTKVIIN